jgi:hypothetical protein
MQASSSFLLWATAAQQCGAALTRQCVLDALARTHSWTGHGLHVETDPGRNQAPTCGVLLQLEGTKFVRVAPPGAGRFDCDPRTKITVDTPAVRAAKLDANGISREFG